MANYHAMKNDDLFAAAEELGIDNASEMTRKDIIELLKAADASEDSEPVDEAPKAEVPVPDTVDIFIHNQDGPAGSHAVFVSHNGVAYQIPREKRVTIPRKVFLIMEQAIETHFDRDNDGNYIERNIKRFPYTVYETA